LPIAMSGPFGRSKGDFLNHSSRKSVITK